MRLILGALVLLLPACSDEPAEEFLRPVRLLELNVDETSLVIAEQSFRHSSDLSDWFVLSRDSTSLTPADGAEGVSIENGCLVLDRSWTALVRFFSLPANERLGLTVLTDLEKPFVANSRCHDLSFLPVSRLEEDESGAETLESWRQQRELTPALHGLMLNKVLLGIREGRFRWNAAPDDDGIATTRMVISRRGKQEIRALFVPCWKHPRRVAGFRFERLPILTTNGMGLSDLDDMPGGPIVRRVRLAGEVRNAAAVPAGGRLVLNLEAPRGSTTLSLGLALSDHAAIGSNSHWKVEAGSEGRWVELGEGTLSRSTESVPSYEDHAFDWPFPSDAGRAASVRLSCEGEGMVLFGTPHLLVRDQGKRLPNLLFISVDTLRADHLGLYGYDRPTSPFLERFAERATVVENYFAVAPYTLPTHATMLTGLFPPKHGAVDQEGLDTSRVAYLPVLLAREGYATGGFTASGYLSEEFGFADGFDRYGLVDPIDRGDDQIKDLYRTTDDSGAQHSGPLDRRRHSLGAAARWIESKREQQWFAFLHTFVTHQYRPPERDGQLFDTGARGAWDGVEYERLEEHNSWLEHPPEEGDVQHLIDLYDATIHYCDRMLGQFLDHLEAEGLLKNTVVVITSDHGEEFFEHGGLKHSVTMYDEMLHVPLIVRLDGQTKGLRVRDPISQVDLMPTLLDIMGLDPLENTDGFSQLNLFFGERAVGRTAPLFAHVQTQVSCRESLRYGPYKIIRNELSPDVSNPAAREWELYDLRSDRAEQENLAQVSDPGFRNMAEHLEAVRAMIWSGAVQGRKAEISEELADQLKQLGYLDK
ncbi:MAG: sulfatase [Planctomycetota bacterium]